PRRAGSRSQATHPTTVWIPDSEETILPINREPVTAPNAPAAIGPYVHAVRAGGLLFCSGQIPLDPRTGDLVGGSAGEQAGRCLENLAAVCDAAGATLGNAVKVTVYLTVMWTDLEVIDVYGWF